MMHLRRRAVEEVTAPGSEHGVAAEEQAVDDVRDVAIDVALRQEHLPGDAAKDDSVTVVDLFGDAGNVARHTLRPDDAQLPEQTTPFEIAVDPDMVTMCVRV